MAMLLAVLTLIWMQWDVRRSKWHLLHAYIAIGHCNIQEYMVNKADDLGRGVPSKPQSPQLHSAAFAVSAASCGAASPWPERHGNHRINDADHSIH